MKPRRPSEAKNSSTQLIAMQHNSSIVPDQIIAAGANEREAGRLIGLPGQVPQSLPVMPLVLPIRKPRVECGRGMSHPPPPSLHSYPVRMHVKFSLTQFGLFSLDVSCLPVSLLSPRWYRLSPSCMHHTTTYFPASPLVPRVGVAVLCQSNVGTKGGNPREVICRIRRTPNANSISCGDKQLIKSCLAT